MTVWSKRKRTVAKPTTEIIEWMQTHTIGDLKAIASSTEQNGGDASSVKRLLADLETLQHMDMDISGFSLEAEASSASP